MKELFNAHILVPLQRPNYLGSEYWNAIDLEHQRLLRAHEANDLGEVVGQCKALVESISRVTLELDGRPAASDDSFDKIVKNAHNLLVDQRTEGNSVDSAGRTAATQILKLVSSLGPYRNSKGSGHGRAFIPEILNDTAGLITVSSLVWVHWALPRVGKFAYGRPEALIRDLVLERATFRRNSLLERLQDANLPKMDRKHQREVGVAVARRAMQETFIVQQEGVESHNRSNSVDFWTEQYRLGVATGLFTDKNGELTVNKWGVEHALAVLKPLKNFAEEIGKINNLLCQSRWPAKPFLTQEEKIQLAEVFNLAEEAHEGEDLQAIQALRETLGVPPF